jgi:hypothetical protein
MLKRRDHWVLKFLVIDGSMQDLFTTLAELVKFMHNFAG